MKIEWRNIGFFHFILDEEKDVGRFQGCKNVFDLYSIVAQYFDLDVHYCTLITTVLIIIIVVVVVIIIIIICIKLLVSFQDQLYLYICVCVYIYVCWGRGRDFCFLYCLQNC